MGPTVDSQPKAHVDGAEPPLPAATQPTPQPSPQPTPQPQRDHQGRRTTPGAEWLIAAAALVAYLLLGQNALHGFDGYAYLRRIDAGELYNGQSALYYPVGWVWAQAMALCSVDLYPALRALSAVAAVLGVLAAHRTATAFGLERKRALAATALVASLPAVVHTASIVEIDAIVFALSCLAWWPFAICLMRGRTQYAVLAGACTALAALFHAAGHLLAVSLCGWLLVWRLGRSSGPGAVLAGGSAALLLGCTHAVVAFSGAWLLGTSSGQATMASNTAALGWHLDLLPTVCWREWLLPYFVPGILAFAAIRQRHLRGAVFGLGLILCGYLLVTTRILGTFASTANELPHGQLSERGAFLLCLSLPLCLLTCSLLRARTAWIVAAVTAAFAIFEVERRDWPADPPGFAAGYARIAIRGTPIVIVANAREQAWIQKHHPSALCELAVTLEILAIEAMQTSGKQVPAGMLRLSLLARSRVEQAHGRRLIVTADALERLRHSKTTAWPQAIGLLKNANQLPDLGEAGFPAFAIVE